AFYHLGYQGLGKIESRVKVYGKHLLPLLVTIFPRKVVRPYADDVCEYVHFSETLQARLNYSVHFFVLAHVGEQRQRSYTQSLTFLGHLIQAVAALTRYQYEIGALAGKGQGDGLADVAASAGNQRSLVLESHRPSWL